MAFIAPSRGVQVIRRRTETALASFPSRSFYVDATNGNNSNDGRTPDTAWQTVLKVNGGTFVPGDGIFFKRGEEWTTTTLRPPTSGLPGQRITFGAYGTGARPVIKNVASLTVWNDNGGDVWWTVLAGATETFIVRDNVTDELLMDRKTALVDVTDAGDYFHDTGANRLYIFRTSEPTDVEAGQGTYACSLGSRNYITLQDLHLEMANQRIVNCFQGTNPVLQRLTMRDAYYTATTFAGVVPYGSVSILGCTVSRTAATGIQVNGSGGVLDNVLIAGNTVFDCNWDFQGVNGSAWDNNAGIKIWGGGDSGSAVIEYNTVYNCGNVIQEDTAIYKGAGIWVDEWGDYSAIVRYNRCHDNNGLGIYVENHDGTAVHYNLVHGNSTGTAFLFAQHRGGIGLIRNSNYHRVYNNVCYNNEGPQVDVDSFIAPFSNNNIIENNILLPADGTQQALRVTGDNVTDFDDNEIGYNCFGAEQAGFILWGTVPTAYDTYAAFKAQYDADTPFTLTGMVEADPLMVNPSLGDFHLQAGSPCRDAGTDVGLSRDYDNVPVPQETDPAVGAYEPEL